MRRTSSTKWDDRMERLLNSGSTELMPDPDDDGCRYFRVRWSDLFFFIFLIENLNKIKIDPKFEIFIFRPKTVMDLERGTFQKCQITEPYLQLVFRLSKWDPKVDTVHEVYRACIFLWEYLLLEWVFEFWANFNSLKWIGPGKWN